MHHLIGLGACAGVGMTVGYLSIFLVKQINIRQGKDPQL